MTTFYISPLIRLTLILLYIALTLPLPFLAQLSSTTIPPQLLWIGLIFGLIIVDSALKEKVILDQESIAVIYPRWFPSFLRKDWQLSWQEIKDLKMRTTGQGGLVYYFITHSADRAYLLPMRIAGFTKMVQLIQENTNINTQDILPLAQPWMYFILLIFTLILLLIDIWTIFSVINH
jgi:hypothetical protein